jgi:hypothetical protein
MVTLGEMSDGRTSIKWAVSYQPRFDPWWYFHAVEDHVVRLAAKHLLRTLATPSTLSRDTIVPRESDAVSEGSSA